MPTCVSNSSVRTRALAPPASVSPTTNCAVTPAADHFTKRFTLLFARLGIKVGVKFDAPIVPAKLCERVIQIVYKT